MAIRNMTPRKPVLALARLRAVMAADDAADPEDEDKKLTDDGQILALKEGVALALSQNKAFSQALHGAMDDFDKVWINDKNLTTEGVLFLKKNPEATPEDVAALLTAPASAFMKLLKVPSGTVEDVQLPVEEGQEGEEEDGEGDAESDDKPAGGPPKPAKKSDDKSPTPEDKDPKEKDDKEEKEDK